MDSTVGSAPEAKPTGAKGASSFGHPAPIPHLTGLRGLAAMMVLAAHLAGVLPRDYAVTTDAALASAYLGICGFFVLSGFVLAYNYADNFREPRRWGAAAYAFAVARFARLYPLYLGILIAVLIAQEWIRCSNFACVASYYTMTQSWFGYQSQIPSAELTWSISTEWFFYLAFLLVVPLILALNTRTRCWLALAITLIAAFVSQWFVYEHQAGLSSWLMQRTPGVDQGSMQRWLSYFSPYLRVFDFFMGVVAARLFMIERAAGPPSHRATLVCAASVVGLLIVFALDASGALKQHAPFLEYVRQSHLYAPFIALTLYASARRPAMLGWFGSRFALFLGDRSYAIYLSQYFGPQLYLLLGFAVIPGARWGTAWLRIALLAALLFLVVELAHRLIDTPLRRFLRNALMFRRRGSKQSVSA